MKFIDTSLPGTYLIEPERLEDERGFFARTFCRDEFAARGLRQVHVQCSISFNARRGTLRGMHFQLPPRPEAKLVSCTRGTIYDVVIDLRETSPTCRQWFATELGAENRRMLYIPEGCAHGFQTLEDNCEVHYRISEMHDPDLARGVRWNDPAFAVRWPIDLPILSLRDANFPDYRP